MTDWLLTQMAAAGLPLLFLTTALSCLALPVPASLMMLTAGAFSATGDFQLWQAALAALAGALLGDQLGYLVGRRAGGPLNRLIERFPKRAAILARAMEMLRGRGAPGIFLSRWLFSPLGPYVNFAAGAAPTPWARFTAAGAAGEMVWVALYTGLGYAFSHSLAAAANLAADMLGLLAALAVMLFTGAWLWRARHGHPPHRHGPDAPHRAEASSR